MPLSKVEAARASLYEARRTVELRRYDVHNAQREYDEAVGLRGPKSPQAATAGSALAIAQSNLTTGRANAASARATLASERTSFLGGDALLDPAKLDPQYPLLLLPVRLETKFVTGSKLRVRIYPDDVASDTHEPGLTAEEEKATTAYWSGVAADGEAAAWTEIVGKLGAPRAAWVVKATEPGADPYDRRSHAWTRAAEARVLPDRFVVRGYAADGSVNTAQGALIPEPLALSLTADRGEPLVALAPGLEVDEESRWVFDYPRALAVGMAVELTLTPYQAANGFTRLVAFGVKASMGTGQSADYITSLLDAHRYTNGLAFLRQGTPTNNSASGPSGFGAPDLGARESFALERGTAPTPRDGKALAEALGISSTPLARIARTDAEEQVAAAAMNEALYPATIGYFLEQMMNGAFDGAPVNLAPADVDDARVFFRSWVRGRGPLPALRVGRVPYGILPTSSLAEWVVRSGAERTEARLPELLGYVRDTWLGRTEQVARFDRTGDPDRDLLETLGLDAATRQVRVRHATGSDFVWALVGLLGQRAADYFAEHDLFGQAFLNLIKQPTWKTRAGGLTFADNADGLWLPLVNKLPLSESDALTAPNYIEWIRTATPDDLRAASIDDGKLPLLFYLLRHAALTDYARVALGICITEKVASEKDRAEPELVKLTKRSAKIETVWERMQRSFQSTGGVPLGSWLSIKGEQPSALSPYNEALKTLSDLPTAELERLFTETLDVCSHRLDAWITSLSTQRLARMRAEKPMGVQLGAFGWAESVKPAAGVTTTTLSDGRVVRTYEPPATTTLEDYRPGGYIHAPTPDHAAAAAILRNAFLSRRGEAKGRFGIDLSSKRVRLALDLLEEVRQGQHVGAVLGYRFERSLHDQHADGQIDTYRALFPLVAGKVEGDPPDPTTTDKVAARNVVDALALVRARDAETLPSPLTPEAEVALGRVDELIDATSDLLTAESVYQTLRGNTSAASASFDSLSRGGRPPDPEIARSRRSGALVTHRVAVILGGAGPTDWSAIAATPRSEASGLLNAWMADLLGPPEKIRCRASFTTGSGPATREVWLTELGLASGLDPLPLQAYDAVETLARDGELLPGSELERRIKEVVLNDDATATDITVQYDRDPSWDIDTRSFEEVSELARSIHRLVASARPLRVEDLADNATQATTDPPTWPSIAPAVAKLSEVITALTSALDPLGTAAALRNALRRASQLGIPAAFPLSLVGSGAPELKSLRDQATSVLAEATRRHAEATSAADASLAAKAIFGRDFVLLSDVTLTDTAEISRALTLGSYSSGTPLEKRTWFQQSARVREGMGRLRRFALAAQALRGTTVDFQIAQLPPVEGARWAALPYLPGNLRPPRVTAMELYAPYGIGLSETLHGLMIDEWTERIPAPTEDTAIAFHYDDPGAEAAQTMLLAVPPKLGTTWSADKLANTITETLDLAKIRAVDAELLKDVGQFLPAIYLSGNFNGDTIVTHFATELLRMDALYPEREP